VEEGSGVSVGKEVEVNVAVGGMDVCVGGTGVGVTSRAAAWGAQAVRMLTSKLQIMDNLMLFIFPCQIKI
jgi:hypothetical protein